MSLTVLSLTFGALLVTSPALAQQLHAGRIVAENRKLDTVTISEMGPWHGPSTRPVRCDFHVAHTTKVELAARKNEPGGYKGAFVERAIAITDLRPGDYATVTVERHGGKAVATKIVVVRPEVGQPRTLSQRV